MSKTKKTNPRIGAFANQIDEMYNVTVQQGIPYDDKPEYLNKLHDNPWYINTTPDTFGAGEVYRHPRMAQWVNIFAQPAPEEKPEQIQAMQLHYNQMAANIINQQIEIGQERAAIGWKPSQLTSYFGEAPKQKSKRSKLPKWW